MSLITIMTDFGLKDGNVGVMKGVIYSIAPRAAVVDLSHLISPQNILEANYVLTRSIPFFPDGTAHIFVIDPGVGTRRRPMIAQLGQQFLIGPDNGALSGLILKARESEMQTRFFELDRPQYWLPKVSHVFHGRDIFAPVAAHFAAGVPINQLGSEFYDPVVLPLKPALINRGRIVGEIVYIDHFGSMASNISEEMVGELKTEPEAIKIEINGELIEGMVKTFGEREPGSLVCLYSSTGVVIVSEVNGNASQRLKGKIGDRIEMSV